MGTNQSSLWPLSIIYKVKFLRIGKHGSPEQRSNEGNNNKKSISGSVKFNLFSSTLFQMVKLLYFLTRHSTVQLSLIDAHLKTENEKIHKNSLQVLEKTKHFFTHDVIIIINNFSTLSLIPKLLSVNLVLTVYQKFADSDNLCTTTL